MSQSWFTDVLDPFCSLATLNHTHLKPNQDKMEIQASPMVFKIASIAKNAF